jgi:hypothetical protein
MNPENEHLNKELSEATKEIERLARALADALLRISELKSNGEPNPEVYSELLNGRQNAYHDLND